MERLSVLCNHFDNDDNNQYLLQSNDVVATSTTNSNNQQTASVNNLLQLSSKIQLDSNKIEKLTAILFDHPDKQLQEDRNRLVDKLKDPIFEWKPYVSFHELRELTQNRLVALSHDPVLKCSEIVTNYKKFSMFQSTLVYSDMSLAVKSSVHWGLFAGSVACLGTEKHEKYFNDIDTCKMNGCFALTELGHGSNVKGVETIAEYDPATQEFIIHTPSDTAQKIWIGNAATYGCFATVFANLVSNGQNYGLHPFLVQIRDTKTLEPLKGISTADNGPKIGLNGVDNGRIWFNKVRIPKDNLLNKFGDIDNAGVYSTPIKNPNVRFNSMLESLIGGRITVANMANSAAKMGLYIAISYAFTRRQFGPTNQKEELLIDYITHQRRLFPQLAEVYINQVGINYVINKFQNKTDKDARDVFLLACGFKAATTWNRSKTLQLCRECCGGQGMAASNKIGILRADTDVDLTYEGDNTVLMQAVSKALLQEFKSYFTGTKRITGMLSYTYSKGHIGIFLRNKNFFTKRLHTESHLLDPDVLLDAFIYREFKLLRLLIKTLRGKVKNEKMSGIQAWNSSLDLVLQLANAYVERVSIEKFLEEVQKASDDIKPVLLSLCVLYELTKIENDLGWFLSNKYFAPIKGQAIGNTINKVCNSLRDHAIPLVKAFDIPSQFLTAPIIGDWVAHYSNPKNF
ncbi:hypothetical protein DICPUDRAFT_158324 [Dictyostelium purpureum]|uniref:Acyl-coenzyme A oxidase n=1 Tax=Dictyostelium purpureum TaxID=5786 RepID=F1A1B8_DICPU|nr:uncharacterized protein DICPUDRAFT_158324 [Dictyostelium purpureum]EGC30018.1 hypothetical protein DICPUDRAFT_158324 [Dictyostelium purpureum]|eukprot:XP_003293464.1 hypothetical protein DICPUDRAFT_158324 [Dictyostelium purpureum]